MTTLNAIIVRFAQWQVSGRTFYDDKARGVQLLVALVYFATGVAFYLKPRKLAQQLGLGVSNSDGVVEIKAFYGTMEVFLGLFLGLSPCSNALACASMLLFGTALGRLVNPSLGSNLHQKIAAMEAVGAAICLAARNREANAHLKHQTGVDSMHRRQHPDPQTLADFVPFCSENLQEPYSWYKALRKEAPVFLVPGLGFHLVSKAEDVVRVCKDVESFSSNLVSILLEGGPSGPVALAAPPSNGMVVDVLAIEDPPKHTTQRRFAQSGLSPKFFAEMEDSIRAQVRELLDESFAESQAPVDWMEHFAFLLPMQVALQLFAFPSDTETAKWVKEMADHGVALLSCTNTPQEFAEHVKGAMSLVQFVNEQFAQVKDDPKSDFIKGLVQGIQSGELSDVEVRSIILQIVFAGNDSSASTLGACVKTLCEKPELVEVLRSDPARQIPIFIDEVLRLESPFAGHYRRVLQPTNIAGVDLQPGDKIMVMWASANRDETWWEAPEEFRMDRGDKGKQHFSFGVGIHHCLGNSLAKREVRIMLEELLGRFQSWKHCGPKAYYIPSTFTRSLARYHVQFTPHKL